MGVAPEPDRQYLVDPGAVAQGIHGAVRPARLAGRRRAVGGYQRRGADEAGGVELWPFSDTYLRLSAKKDADGDPIIDANPGNFDERWAEFVQLHRDHFDAHGMPEYGGTEVMLAIAAGDAHFIGNPKDPQDKGEFGERPAAERPFRLRSLWTDGALEDKAGFIAYLSQATPVIDPTVSETTTIGLDGQWDEAWLVGIFGEEGGGGHKAYEEYVELAKTHPWIYPLYFENVINDAEITEDMSLAGVPAAIS